MKRVEAVLLSSNECVEWKERGVVEDEAGRLRPESSVSSWRKALMSESTMGRSGVAGSL